MGIAQYFARIVPSYWPIPMSGLIAAHMEIKKAHARVVKLTVIKSPRELAFEKSCAMLAPE